MNISYVNRRLRIDGIDGDELDSLWLEVFEFSEDIYSLVGKSKIGRNTFDDVFSYKGFPLRLISEVSRKNTFRDGDHRWIQQFFIIFSIQRFGNNCFLKTDDFILIHFLRENGLWNERFCVNTIGFFFWQISFVQRLIFLSLKSFVISAFFLLASVVVKVVRKAGRWAPFDFGKFSYIFTSVYTANFAMDRRNNKVFDRVWDRFFDSAQLAEEPLGLSLFFPRRFKMEYLFQIRQVFKERSNSDSFFLFEEFLRVRDIIRVLLLSICHLFQLSWCALSKKFRIVHKGYNYSILVVDVLLDGFAFSYQDSILHGLTTVRAYRNVTRKLCIFCYDEVFTRNRFKNYLIHSLRKDITVYSVQHAHADFTKRFFVVDRRQWGSSQVEFEFLPDKFIVFSSTYRDLLVSGVGRQRVLLGSALGLVKNYTGRNGRKERGSRLNILVAPSLGSEIFSFGRFLREIVSLDVRLRIRFHPFLDRRSVLTHFDSIGVKNVGISEGSVSQSLDWADLVVGCDSSFLIEALIHSIPVAQLLDKGQLRQVGVIKTDYIFYEQSKFYAFIESLIKDHGTYDFEWLDKERAGFNIVDKTNFLGNLKRLSVAND